MDLAESFLARPLELCILKKVERHVLELDEEVLRATAEERFHLSILLERQGSGSIEDFVLLINNLELCWATKGKIDGFVLVPCDLATTFKSLAIVVLGLASVVNN